MMKETCHPSTSFISCAFPHFPLFLSFLLLSFHPKPNVFGHVRCEKKAGRRRRKKGQFWGNMAHINLEILFYLIWTKLLLWTRCPRRAGTEPPQPRWARTGRKICHRDHGVLMNPWFSESRSYPFMQRDRHAFLLLLDSMLYSGAVSPENPQVLETFSPFPSLSCLPYALHTCT